jgi:hypothetical protein
MLEEERKGPRMWSELFSGGNSLVDERSSAKAVIDAITPGGLLNVSGGQDETPSTISSLLSPGGGITAPMSPFEQAKENHGGGLGFFIKSMMVAKNPALAGWLMPELSKSNLARYASDLELYNTYREMSLVDPQVEALAQDLEKRGLHLQAKIVRAGGVDDYDFNNKVLSPGQNLVSGIDSNVIASGQEKDNRTTDERNADALANSLGVDRNTPEGRAAYADIFAAVAEPTITTTLPDGTVKTSNSIDAVLGRWSSGGYGNDRPQPEGNPSQGTTSGGSGRSGDYFVSPDEASQATLNQAITEQTAQEAASAEVALKDYDRIMTSVNNLGEWKETTDAQGNKVRKFVPVSGFETILGNIGGTWGAKGISTLFSQDAANAEAELNTLLSKLTVNERQRLVGQGQITEGEQKMLADAVSILTSTTISEERAGEALETIVTIMGDSKDRAENLLSTADPQNRMESRHMSGEGVSFGGKVYHKESDFLKDAQAKGADMEKAQAKWRELTGG